MADVRISWSGALPEAPERYDPANERMFRAEVARLSAAIDTALQDMRGAGAGEYVFGSYIDFKEIATPSNPPTETLRLYAGDEGGFGTLHFVNSDGVDYEIGRDIIHVVRNVSGGQLDAGEAVYVTGSNGTFPTVALAQANADSTMPVFGLVVEDIPDNSFGRVLQLGDLSGIDTSAFSEGAIVYADPSTAGGLTATKPSGANKIQRVGVVTKSNAGSGIISVILSGSGFVDQAADQTIGGSKTFTQQVVVSSGAPSVKLDETGAGDPEWLLQATGGSSRIQNVTDNTGAFTVRNSSGTILLEVQMNGSGSLVVGDLEVKGTIPTVIFTDTNGTDGYDIRINGGVMAFNNLDSDTVDYRFRNQSADNLFRIQSGSLSGQTALHVEYHDGTSLKTDRITLGAADSGGAGFKVLRVPN